MGRVKMGKYDVKSKVVKEIIAKADLSDLRDVEKVDEAVYLEKVALGEIKVTGYGATKWYKERKNNKLYMEILKELRPDEYERVKNETWKNSAIEENESDEDIVEMKKAQEKYRKELNLI